MSETLKSRAARLVVLKDDMTRARHNAEKAEKAYRDAERDLWIELEDAGMKTGKFDLGDGQEVSLQRRETITSRVIDEDEAVAALEAEGLADELLGNPQIRKRVLNEVTRNRLQAGQPLIPGTDFYPRRYLTVTKKG